VRSPARGIRWPPTGHPSTIARRSPPTPGGAEHDPDGTTLARLRERLVPHPATLGRLIDRLARRGFVELAPDPADRRRRTVRTTGEGLAVCREASLAGPVRLRHTTADPDRLRRLAAACEDAVELFGWKEWAR
jgi:DNA-binding MarR family transcriptional regulator